MAVIAWLLSIIIALAFSSCNRKQSISSSITKTLIKDSISLIETIKYDTITLPADTLVQSVYIECDSLTNKPKPFNTSIKSNKISNSLVLDITGLLTSTSIVDSLLQVIETQQRELHKYHSSVIEDTLKETEFVKYIPKFFRYCFAIAIIIIGLTTLKYILKWRKIINPLW